MVEGLEEFAAQLRLGRCQTMIKELAEKVNHIRVNMHTLVKWDIDDFRDFYQWDVEFLLSLADAHIAYLTKCEQRVDGQVGDPANGQ